MCVDLAQELRRGIKNRFPEVKRLLQIKHSRPNELLALLAYFSHQRSAVQANIRFFQEVASG
jgi:hypothetical protein